MQSKLLTQLSNVFQLRQAKKIAMSLTVSAILGLPQFANAFAVGGKTSVDSIDKTTSLGYTIMLVMAGLMIVAVFCLAAWALITGPGEGVMKLFIRGGAAGILLAIGFWVAPGFYNFCF